MSIAVSLLPAAEPASRTDRLGLAAAAYLARFSGPSRTHTESDLRIFLSWCAERRVDPLAVERAQVELYVRWMQEIRQLQPSTVSRRMSVVAGFYRICVIDGILEHSLAEHVRHPPVPAESPTLGLTHPPLEALLSVARDSASRRRATLPHREGGRRRHGRGRPVATQARPHHPGWRVARMICSICGRSAACEISHVTNCPWCKACQKRRARCADCGRVELIRGGTIDAPLCAVCTRPDPAFWGCCPTCGHRQLSTRSCTRCNLRQRLRVLLADHDGDDVRVELRGLHDNLVESDRPSGVLEWLNKASIAELLRELGTGQRALSHAGLDELPASKPIEHLRAILVATGTLPSRDEHLARLERWIARILAEHDDPEQRQLLHRYAIWHLLHRLRQRNDGAHATFSQVVTVKRNLNAATALLDGLAIRGRGLADARQTDLDTWLTSDQARYRRDAGHFVRWAQRQKLTSLELPATRWQGPARTIDVEARWQQARWLLHGPSRRTPAQAQDTSPAPRQAGEREAFGQLQ